MYIVVDRKDKKRVAVHRFATKEELETFCSEMAVEQYAGKRTFTNIDGETLAAGNFIVINGGEVALSVHEVKQPKFVVDMIE